MLLCHRLLFKDPKDMKNPQRIKNLNLSISATELSLIRGWILVFFLLSFAVDQASAQKSKLFNSQEVLEITVSCDLKGLMRDRGEDPENHEASLHYVDNQEARDIPIRVKVRGHFRKMTSNCKYPPSFLILLNPPPLRLHCFMDKIKSNW